MDRIRRSPGRNADHGKIQQMNWTIKRKLHRRCREDGVILPRFVRVLQHRLRPRSGLLRWLLSLSMKPKSATISPFSKNTFENSHPNPDYPVIPAKLHRHPRESGDLATRAIRQDSRFRGNEEYFTKEGRTDLRKLRQASAAGLTPPIRPQRQISSRRTPGRKPRPRHPGFRGFQSSPSPCSSVQISAAPTVS